MNLKKYVIMKRLLVYFVCLMAFLTYSENGYCQTGESYFQQGMEYHDAKDYENAAKCFLYSADRGHPGGLNMLGLYFMNGTALPRDPEKAFTLFKAAAERGESNAAHNVGRCYFDGDGVEKNYVEAKKWFSKAYDLGDKSDEVVNLSWRAESFINAEKGDAEAQWIVGNFYKYGEYVEKDLVEAVKWFRKSAEQDYQWAQYHLGECYLEGKGVAQDKTEAVKWLRKAAEQGNESAKEKLKSLE